MTNTPTRPHQIGIGHDGRIRTVFPPLYTDEQRQEFAQENIKNARSEARDAVRFALRKIRMLKDFAENAQYSTDLPMGYKYPGDETNE